MSISTPTNQQMIISQHKRTTYDQDGAVNKVDILRCIRRKDAEPSFLPQVQNEKQNKQQTLSGQQKFKEIVEYLLIGTIVFCSFLLIMSLCGISIQLTDSVAVSQQNVVSNQINKIAFPRTNCTESNCDQEFNGQFNFQRDQQAISHFYDNFLSQLERLKNDDNSSLQKKDKIKLSEMRKVMKIGDETKWKDILLTFALNLHCRIQSNKIVCQHELNL